MLERIDVYGIDTPDLERVAKVLEMKFNIEFEAENDGEMGGVFFEYGPHPERDFGEFWTLFRLDDHDADEDEEETEEPPIKLRIQDAPDMDDVRRKMAEIKEFKVALVDWVVIDSDTGNVIAEHDSDEPSPEDGVVNAT